MGLVFFDDFSRRSFGNFVGKDEALSRGG